MNNLVYKILYTAQQILQAPWIYTIENEVRIPCVGRK